MQRPCLRRVVHGLLNLLSNNTQDHQPSDNAPTRAGPSPIDHELRRYSTDFSAHSPSPKGIFSIEVLSSEMTLAYIKLL